MAGKGKSKTSPAQLAVEEKQVKAMELRKAGVGFREIAEELGYSSASGAHAAVMAALEKARSEPAESLRDLMLTRLDDMLAGLWTAAISGDPDSVSAVLRIEERRAKLLGLDKVAPPVMMAVSKVSVGDIDFTKLSNDELREILRQGQDEDAGDQTSGEE